MRDDWASFKAPDGLLSKIRAEWKFFTTWLKTESGPARRRLRQTANRLNAALPIIRSVRGRLTKLASMIRANLPAPSNAWRRIAPQSRWVVAGVKAAAQGYWTGLARDFKRMTSRSGAAPQMTRPPFQSHIPRAAWAVSAGFVVLIGLLGLGLAGIVLFYRSYAEGLVPPEQLAIDKPIVGAKILDRHGRLLYEYVDDAGVRKPVALDQVSPDLLAATIVTEDASFYSNPGVNLRGVARAAWENFSPFAGSPLKGSGGSSITQQLVKNVYIPRDERTNRSFDRKMKEAVYAVELTRRYSKDQILNWYVNLISYGGLYLGIESASEAYFGKPAIDLTLAEAALLAGLPQAPGLYDPIAHPEAAVARRNEVLDILGEHKTVRIGRDAYYESDQERIEAAKQEPLSLIPRKFTIEAPHFVLTYLQPELVGRFGREALLHDGLIVTTSLDLDLQHRAEDVVERWVSEFEATSNTHNGAVVVLDPRSGEILAMVGSRDYFRDDILGKNNNLLALNSPGSTLKPFVYLDSFVKFNAGPASLISDTAVKYTEANGTVFEPKNPGNNFRGIITVRQALGNSLNVPAFRVAQALGVDEIVGQAKRVGLTDLNGSYGPSIAIGGVDLKPLDLTYAYTSLANGGVLRGADAVPPHAAGERDIDPVSILRVTSTAGAMYEAEARRTERRIFSEEHAFLVNSILSDPGAHCWTFGCGGLSVPGYSVAVKTGTSEPFDPRGPNAGKIGETWAFGYTPDVVVGVWAGNADNAPITNILSTSIAFRAMRDLVLSYYGDRPATPFVSPPGVVRAKVCYRSPVSMCVDDFFLKSQSPAPVGDGGSGAAAPPVAPLGSQPAPAKPPAPQPPKKPRR